MKNKIILIFLFVALITTISALPICVDTNLQDISKIPCVGFTPVINCTGNVTAFNTTDVTINYSIQTYEFTGGILNFTINLSRGEYELIDCANNTATILIGLVEQGYGINLFGIMIPAIILSFLSLFVSGRLFNRFCDEDEEKEENLRRENDHDSFVPKSRLVPIVFMLFGFIPMIFMVGFVNAHLEEYLPSLNITPFYGLFYILLSTLFYFIFLVSFLVWLSSFIKLRRVMRGLDDIE